MRALDFECSYNSICLIYYSPLCFLVFSIRREELWPQLHSDSHVSDLVKRNEINLLLHLKISLGRIRIDLSQVSLWAKEGSL